MKSRDEIQNRGPVAESRYLLGGLINYGAPDKVIVVAAKRFWDTYQDEKSSSLVEEYLRSTK